MPRAIMPVSDRRGSGGIVLASLAICLSYTAIGTAPRDAERGYRYSEAVTMVTVEHWIDLRCHPSARTETVRTIRVLVRRSANAELQIAFRLDGDISQLRVPAWGVPRFAAELWRHTCFEAFIARDGQPAYHEFNFAPSGDWAVYAFRGYRDGGPLAVETMRPQIAVRSTGNLLELDALVRLDRLSALHPHASLRVGLAAVVEESDGLSFWALRHPTDKPDFHNAAGFALPLEPPVPSAC